MVRILPLVPCTSPHLVINSSRFCEHIVVCPWDFSTHCFFCGIRTSLQSLPCKFLALIRLDTVITSSWVSYWRSSLTFWFIGSCLVFPEPSVHFSILSPPHFLALMFFSMLVDLISLQSTAAKKQKRKRMWLNKWVLIPVERVGKTGRLWGRSQLEAPRVPGSPQGLELLPGERALGNPSRGNFISSINSVSLSSLVKSHTVLKPAGPRTVMGAWVYANIHAMHGLLDRPSLAMKKYATCNVTNAYRHKPLSSLQNENTLFVASRGPWAMLLESLLTDFRRTGRILEGVNFHLVSLLGIKLSFVFFISPHGPN